MREGVKLAYRALTLTNFVWVMQCAVVCFNSAMAGKVSVRSSGCMSGAVL